MSTRDAPLETELTRLLGIKYPIICGAMYPCSNPELVAAVSEAGGIGIVQPMSLTYVYGHDYRDGIRHIRSLTNKPIGVNMLVEGSNATYRKRLESWMEISVEEGVEFFVTCLGNPRWVVEKAATIGATVFHDVTNLKHAKKALDNGVDGFICVNDRAGGHAGTFDQRQLRDDIATLGKPVVCAGGISNRDQFLAALEQGYCGVQLGTRFIATKESATHSDYKQAIVQAGENDIVLTEKISGVPVSVIRTPYIDRMGTKAGWLAKRMLKGRKTKHWMRMFYTVMSAIRLKNSTLKGGNYKDFWQAGKSVEGIESVQSVESVIRDLVSNAADEVGSLGSESQK